MAATPQTNLNPETEPYWQAAREGRLLIGRCRSCGQVHHYPRALCPFCFGETEMQECSGEGTVYSFSIMRRADPPYAIAFVRLAEGVSLMTNILTDDLDGLRVDMPVRAAFGAEGHPDGLVMFRPA